MEQSPEPARLAARLNKAEAGEKRVVSSQWSVVTDQAMKKLWSNSAGRNVRFTHHKVALRRALQLYLNEVIHA